MAHDHAHIDLESGDRRVSISIWANGLLTVAQIVGGILSGSLALIADALHNFSDMASLGDHLCRSENRAAACGRAHDLRLWADRNCRSAHQLHDPYPARLLPDLRGWHAHDRPAHLWQMQEHKAALDCHIVLTADGWR